MGRAFLGSYTSDGGHGLGVATADPHTGVLMVEEWLTDVADPSWAALSPDGHNLYAASESGGTVHAFRLTGDGRPVLLNGEPTGRGPCHVRVHPAGKHLYTSLYTAGRMMVHPIAADGCVGAAIREQDHGPGKAHAHAVALDPTGQWILTADLGADAVFVSHVDTGDAVRVPLATGSGPRHLVFHPDGEHVYVACELDSTVAVCSWRDGRLAPVGTVSTLDTPMTNYPGEIAISADGRFLYVSNRGHNSIAVFSVAGADLRLLGTPSCGGDWPRHFAIDPTGRWLYAANQRSGDVTWFALDPDTGLPSSTPDGQLKVPAASQVLFAS